MSVLDDYFIKGAHVAVQLAKDQKDRRKKPKTDAPVFQGASNSYKDRSMGDEVENYDYEGAIHK